MYIYIEQSQKDRERVTISSSSRGIGGRGGGGLVVYGRGRILVGWIVKIRLSVLRFALAHLILTAFRRFGLLAGEPF
jgi:hypothetical protein